MVFECNGCGACCKLLVTEFAPEMDRGDGICINLKDNKCSIYENRPDKCRHGYSYRESDMSREEYDKLSTEICVQLEAIASVKFQ